ncbi:hypothetical protein RhiirA5_414976 [Rhizophagus irregularis]|uniref:Kelch-like protein 17 n=1 Tax=Rhizophagus irregularis TaxID=588596 RepID=A0A2N0PSY9_9GLOM|nr:hypothetical protein RhiirA5_414976 [Rhizophagus irregularis]
MVILNYRSPYLRRILSTNKKKNDGTLAHIKLPNILPDIFQIIIRYIYGGRISLIEYDILDIIKILVKILVAANELSLQELISHLQSFLIENNENWTEQNFNLIYQMTIENDSFLDLQKKALISLIQHDNHQMGEVQVWEHVLKWGIAQNPGLSSDPSCIKIIPEELYEDTIKYFLDKNSKNLDSIIITTQHAELISKWINRLEITDELKNSYEFKLILRGSRDGFTAKLFHEICDNQSHTVTIFKVKDTNEILGGYNPIEWKNDYGIFRDYGTTKDSFIFSFMNKESIKDHIISRVKDEYYAICYCHNYGPSFGDKDLTIYGGHEGVASFRNKKSYCQENSYEKQIRKMEDDFSVEEYENNGKFYFVKPNITAEVFQIILRYIYSGTILLNEQDTSEILRLVVAAPSKEISNYLRRYLIENKSEWMKLNFELAYQISFQSNNLLELQQFCTDLMAKSPGKIFELFDFTSLYEKSLISLIERDDLQMKEIEVWE